MCDIDSEKPWLAWLDDGILHSVAADYSGSGSAAKAFTVIELYAK